MPNKIQVSRTAPATKKRHPKKFTESELNNMKLHQLLGVAIKDAVTLSRKRRWKWAMTREYVKEGRTHCQGCLAGAVLRCQLGVRTVTDYNLPSFAFSLDSLRQGNVAGALSSLGRYAQLSDGYRLNRKIPKWRDFAPLEPHLRKLQADLKKADL